MQNWTLQKTISPAETFLIDYKIKVGDSYQTLVDEVSFPPTSEVLTEYTTLVYVDKDGKEQSQDVVANTISTTTTCVGAANPTRWKSKLEAGSPAFPGAVLVKRTETFNKYIITEDGPVEREITTYEYEPWIAFAGGLAIENYKNIDLGVRSFLVRKTIVEKEENKAADLTLQITTIYQAWGATAVGKTIASVAMAGLKREADAIRISGTYALVDRMSALVCTGVEKTINIGRGLAPSQPTALDQQNDNLRNVQDSLNSNGGWNINNPKGDPYKSQLVDLSFGSDGISNTDKYDMEFAPDSYLRPSDDAGDNGTGLSYVYLSSAAAAYEYGRAIHYILSGMANGKSITTELRNLPSEPMGTLYLEAAGTVGRFRANGTTFAFDSQGLIAGCDAMLDGGAGLVANATGADWFPMMVPATNLPTVTPAANNSPGLTNTINAPNGFDPMAPGNIWASFGTAGVEGDIYAVELTRGSVVGAVAESVRRESVSRSLSWLLEAPYNVTPVVETLISVAIAYGTFFQGNDLFAGAGAGVITNLRPATTPPALFAGAGAGAIASLMTSAITSELLAGSGAGAIAGLLKSATTSSLLAGSGAGAITTLTDSSAAPATGVRTSGTRAPLLGASSATTFTDWSRIVNANRSQTFILFDGWPFSFYMAGTAYRDCFVGSSGYATFGTGSSAFTSLGESNPAFAKVMFGSGNISYSRIYTKVSNVSAAFRWEGHNDSFGQPGFSNRIVEVTFWKPGSSTQLIEVRTGSFASPSSAQPFLIASKNITYASATTLNANQSWVFEGNLAGTSWTLYSSSYVAV
jgi:hypothetical protein